MKIILVHGFGFALTGRHSPEDLYRLWTDELPATPVKDLSITAWHWYSVPPTLLAAVKAFFHGRLHIYRWAWHLAELEGHKLARHIIKRNASDKQTTLILCHSLGARVVFTALADIAAHEHETSHYGLVEKVIVLNGAEHCERAYEIFDQLGLFMKHVPEIWNFVVVSDDVLRLLGRHFSPKFDQPCIGRKVRKNRRDKWLDVVLDSPADQRHAAALGYPDLHGNLRGFEWKAADGNRPAVMLSADELTGRARMREGKSFGKGFLKRWGDHWESYENRPNWVLFRDIFSGRLGIPQWRGPEGDR